MKNSEVDSQAALMNGLQEPNTTAFPPEWSIAALFCEDDATAEVLNAFPETYAEVKPDGRFLAFYRLSIVETDLVLVRKRPLTDTELTIWAKRVLSEGESTLKKLDLPALLTVQIDPSATLDEDGHIDSRMSDPSDAYNSASVAELTYSTLANVLREVGTTDDEQKKLIILKASALAISSEPDEMDEGCLRALEKPWESALWQKIVNAVTVSQVYAEFKEKLFASETVRFKCLLGHPTDGEDVICTDDHTWRCRTCGETGDSFSLFHAVKGPRGKKGESNWTKNSKVFSIVAGKELSNRWHAYLREQARKFKEEQFKAATKALDEGEAALHEMNAEYFVARFNGKVQILHETRDVDGNCVLVPYLPLDFGTMLAHKQVSTCDSKGMIVSRPIAPTWLNWADRRSYEAVVFYPGELPEPSGERFFNTWTGLEVMPRKGDFSKIEYHLREIWCKGNQEWYDYLILWFAHLMQYPAEKPGVALVVKGKKGTGKSTIFEVIFEKILGSMYAKIDLGEQVTGKFNSHLRGKLLLVLEEAIWAGSKSAEGRLKSMITDARTMYEPKGVDAFEEASYMRLAFVSNEKRAVPASNDARRYFALSIGNDKKCDTAYFSALRQEIDNGGREAFLDFLLNYPVDEDAVRVPPLVPALWNDIYEGQALIDKWLYDSLNTLPEERGDNDPFLWEGFVPTHAFSEDFQKDKEDRQSLGGYIGYNDITSQKKLTMYLRDFFDFPLRSHKNQRCMFIPDLKTARQKYAQEVRYEVPWDDLDFSSEEGLYF